MRTLAISQIGASHSAGARPCQDYSASGQTADYAWAVVADGHGGAAYFRSDRGSRMAVEAAQSVLTAFAASTHAMRDLPSGDWKRQVASALVAEWQQRIEADYRQEPFDTHGGHWQKAYGTTLIATLCTERDFFGLQIGDGHCVAIAQNDTCVQPVPWDKRCFLNRTTSLCDKDALNEFRFCMERANRYKAIFVATDGAEDCFAGTEGLYDFYRVLHGQLRADFEKAVDDLRGYLPTMSQRGSTDDISVAGIVRDAQL